MYFETESKETKRHLCFLFLTPLFGWAKLEGREVEKRAVRESDAGRAPRNYTLRFDWL